MKRSQIILLFLLLIGLGILFFLTYPSIGSILIAMIFLIITGELLWQHFLNR